MSAYSSCAKTHWPSSHHWLKRFNGSSSTGLHGLPMKAVQLGGEHSQCPVDASSVAKARQSIVINMSDPFSM
ncbi:MULTISPECIES: hypothetical protein [unclassified Nocardioides]|uniref:hypothetical protein n=1 Tax=unclassified Nocardioides TaxID=2615069 RepID=UPI00005713F2|nr:MULTISPECIES: hypothetical protein [unclassified Nocardioides]ABL81782.1 hypothetical protein Noca_2277 [Nocardioides sp. JS614]